MPTSRSLINHQLTPQRESLLVWGGLTNAARVVDISSDIVGCVGGESCLPRLEIKWGHGSASHIIICDLAGFLRFSVPSANGSVSVFAETSEVGGNLISPSFDIFATLSKGYAGKTKCSYTTPRDSVDGISGAPQQPIPRGAYSISMVIPHPPAAGGVAARGIRGAPPGEWIQTMPAFMGATNYDVRMYPFEEILNNPRPIHQSFGSIYFAGALVQGGSWTVYSDVSDPADHPVQFIFGIEV